MSADTVQAESGGKRILIISFSHMSRDQRVRRQIHHLSQKHRVVTAGFDSPGMPGVEFVPIYEIRKSLGRNIYRAMLLKTHQFLGYYTNTFQYGQLRSKLSREKMDLIIANDNDSLPLAFEIAGGARILHDAHEYSPLQLEDRFDWRFFMQAYRKWICRTYLPRCDAVTTVSQGIADEYARVYGVSPKVITNAPDYVDLQPSPVQENRFRMIHHGIASRSRKLELMIDLMDQLDERFSLDIMLVPSDQAYLDHLKRLAKRNERVRIIDPVPSSEIIPVSNAYDIGLLIPEAASFNILHSLPNKFFEYIQSRLAIAITPLPEMARLVRAYDCGVVSDNYEPSSMAKKLLALNKEKLEYYKDQSSNAAKVLCSSANMQLLDSLVEDLTSRQ